MTSLLLNMHNLKANQETPINKVLANKYISGDHAAQECACKNLWAEVLTAALADLVGCASEASFHKLKYETHEDYRKRQQVSVRDWFESGSYEPASFLWICEVLGLEPDAVLENTDRFKDDYMSRDGRSRWRKRCTKRLLMD